MESKLEIKHWEQCKKDNNLLILQSLMTIEMAKTVLIMAEKKIKAFPKEKEES